MENQLIIDGKRIACSQPKTKAVTTLYENLERLPDAIPAHINRSQFIMAITAEANKLPAETTPWSICNAAFNCAVLGLIPGAALGHAYLVPLKNKKRQITECNLWVGYKGYLHLAYGCDFLAGCCAEVVLKDEKVRRGVTAEGPFIEHEMPITRIEDWDKVIAAYCVYQTRMGSRGVHVIPREVLVELKRRQGNVWNSNPIEMSKKTPIRRAANHWDLSRDLGNALMIDSESDREVPQQSLHDWERRQTEPTIQIPPKEQTPDERYGVPEYAEGLGPLLAIAESRDDADIRFTMYCVERNFTQEQTDALLQCIERRYKELDAADGQKEA